jgi:hypothetical protein
VLPVTERILPIGKTLLTQETMISRT